MICKAPPPEGAPQNAWKARVIRRSRSLCLHDSGKPVGPLP